MKTIASLVAHSIAFTAFVGLCRPDTVAPVALLGVFVAGFAFLVWAPRHKRCPRSPVAWLATFVYAILLAAVFAGADFAMEALGNSIRSRAPLPPAFGGLELYWLLVFGVATVAVGALVGSTVERRAHSPAKSSSSMGHSQ